MTAVIFNGREFARKKTEELAKVIRNFSDIKKKPKLVAILVGDNLESRLYLSLKGRKAVQLGINFEFREFSENNPQEVIDYIEKKNMDQTVNGIIVELPLPAEWDEYIVLDKIRPDKDVDCLTSENLRLLAEGRPRFVPPTVKAVGEILKEAGGVAQKKVVVVGSNGSVGKGILSYLKDAEGIDRGTEDLASVTKNADVLISATGVGYLIKREMVKPGAVVIDVGIEKKRDLACPLRVAKQGGRGVVGDVDFENVKEVASFITPVPGGVGPVTVVCLMENLIGSVYH